MWARTLNLEFHILLYMVVQQKWPLFENSLPSAARQRGIPMHSQSAHHGKFKLNSLQLAPFHFAQPCNFATSSYHVMVNSSLFCSIALHLVPLGHISHQPSRSSNTPCLESALSQPLSGFPPQHRCQRRGFRLNKCRKDSKVQTRCNIEQGSIQLT